MQPPRGLNEGQQEAPGCHPRLDRKRALCCCQLHALQGPTGWDEEMTALNWGHSAAAELSSGPQPSARVATRRAVKGETQQHREDSRCCFCASPTEATPPEAAHFP